MTMPAPSDPEPNGPELGEPEARNLVAVAALMLFVFLVLLAVFLYISRLSPAGPSAGGPGQSELEGTVVSAGAGGAAAGAGTSQASPGPLPTVPGHDGTLVRYDDPRYAFRVDVPDTWQRAAVDTVEPAFPDAGYDVVFEDADSGARLAVSVWDDEPVPTIGLWVPVVAPGMRPVSGRWEPTDTVAGEPALAMWSAGSPAQPARYAFFLSHAGKRYRVAYSAADGGALIGDFVRALVSLEFGPDDTPDLVAPLPQPTPHS